MSGARPSGVSMTLATGIDDRELSRIVSRAADMLCLVDEQGRLLEVNRQGRLVLGYSPAEISNLTLFDVDPDLDLEKLRELRAAIRPGGCVDARHRLRCKGGKLIPVEVRFGVVEVQGRGPTLLFAARDVADRDVLQKRLLDALTGAEEASRSKNAFLGNLSHEIRTPLNAIVGYSSLVATLLEGANDADATMILGRLRAATERLLNMVHSTLDLSTLHRGEFRVRPESLRLASLVAAEVHRFAADAEKKGLELRFRSGRLDPRIRFDRYCLSKAVEKLLDNAIKFTDRGAITVALARAADGGLDLEVEDTGMGIGAAYLRRVFEPFSQEDAGLSRRFEGTGIGLALAKQFLEANGAAISVRSERGHGTRVRIHFPKKLVSPRTLRPLRRSSTPSAARPSRS